MWGGGCIRSNSQSEMSPVHPWGAVGREKPNVLNGLETADISDKAILYFLNHFLD